MDFLDNEAVESEDEEELTEGQRRKAQRLKAVESDEEDEDDEQRYEEELRDLIDDNPIEEDSDGGDSDSSTKKRKKSDDEELDDRLEDEDYDLIEENLGVKVARRKRFKRVRQFEDDDEREEGEGEDREAIANELFDGASDHEGDERPERSREEGYDEENLDEEGYTDDEDDFIVDDDGRPITAGKKKRKHIFNDAALQEAQDIFGVDFDFDDFEKYGEEYDEEDEDEDEDEYMDDDTGEPKKRKAKKAARKKPTRKSIFEIYEPSELKRGHFTDLDNQIRNNDIPERMQLRDIPVTPVADDSNELEEEANWIYRQAFCKPTVSTQDCKGGVDPRTVTKKGNPTIGKIKKALDFMRNQQFEVPFIAFYRKEYVLPELNVNDLWKVYKYDGKWCQLKARKEALLELFENMRQFQLEEYTQDINAPLPEDVRILSEEDIAAVKEVQTPEELKDVHMHFLLYYSHLIPKMQEKKRAKEREERRQARKQSRRKRANVEDDEESVIDNDNEEEPDEPEEPEPEENEAEVIKPAARSGPYATCRKAKLEGFAKRFGLKPEQFAENFRDNYQRHDVEQEEIEPIELAQEYKGPILQTSEDVLKAVKYMVATQISREPLVRKVLRDAFFERAKLNVIPTKKGIKEIDENHTCYSVKYLKGKPVRELVGVEFLKLHIAEEDKLLKITFEDDIEGLTTGSYLEEMKSLYIRDEFSSVVQEWNDLRNDIIELAYRKMLWPDIIKELKTQLLAEAKECVLKLCSQKLYNWLKVASYSVDFEEEDDDWDTSKGLRIMGLSFVPDLSQAAFACVIAPDGECTDHLRLPNLLRRKNSFREDEKMMKEADLKALRNFILTKKPHVICVGAESRDALMIIQDVKEQVALLVEDEQFPQIPVEVLDNDLAKIYANSIKGENDFRDYPILLRQAISLARRMQDPLVEFSQLCTNDDEILCLRYHALQDYVTQEDLMEAITREFVNRTNEVGVDINQVVQQVYSGNLLQYVCGLGPRKATALIKLLKQNNQRLENRTQLVTMCHMGPKIFINCAGFIKIDTNSLGDSTEAYVEVLDGSRVHPETYEWARKMAVDALEYDDEETNPAGALEEILESPDRLKDLDLDAFAEELERQGFGNKSITLYDIRAELNHRYKDLRAPYTPPNAEELFDLLTKETPESFYIGKMVLATVTGILRKRPKTEQLDQANPVRKDETGLWQCPFCLKSDFPELSEVWNHFDAGGCPGQAIGVRIRLDNGVSGCIFLKFLSDKHVNNPEERVQIGQMIHCRIMKIDVERFSIEATSKTSDLNDENNEWRPPKDGFYDFEMETNDKKIEENKKKMKTSQTYTKRVIVHPSFHNISFSKAVALMENMDQGECIIRPSSKGTDHLTVTWKVADNIYQHIDVLEKDKMNAFSLGRSLVIGTEEFEDLDEIIARYINPMAACARDLLTYKYYKDTEGGKAEIAEKVLREEQEKNPKKIHYIFSVYAKVPGAFILFYLPRKSIRLEYVTVTPDGFRFRKQIFESLNGLLKWFKEHFNDPVPRTPSAMTPHSNHSARNTPYNPQTPMLGMPHMTPVMPPPHTPHLSHTPHYGVATPYNMPPYAAAYTPGQTPYLTPYQHPSQTPRTPFHTQTPRYGQQTPAQASFMHPNMAHRTPSHHQSPLPRNTPSNPNEWGKIAAEWAKERKKD
ncbi:transcription elongation factor SPT6 [Planococcus citri]|uniref:transcription elongation factor SPT6 n=1 Tax=Planococcus citri TaxID=170843 RepID=UPI0031F74E68